MPRWFFSFFFHFISFFVARILVSLFLFKNIICCITLAMAIQRVFTYENRKTWNLHAALKWTKLFVSRTKFGKDTPNRTTSLLRTKQNETKQNAMKWNWNEWRSVLKFRVPCVCIESRLNLWFAMLPVKKFRFSIFLLCHNWPELNNLQSLYDNNRKVNDDRNKKKRLLNEMEANERLEQAKIHCIVVVVVVELRVCCYFYGFLLIIFNAIICLSKWNNFQSNKTTKKNEKEMKSNLTFMPISSIKLLLLKSSYAMDSGQWAMGNGQRATGNGIWNWNWNWNWNRNHDALLKQSFIDSNHIFCARGPERKQRWPNGGACKRQLVTFIKHNSNFLWLDQYSWICSSFR